MALKARRMRCRNFTDNLLGGLRRSVGEGRAT
jgi:hypothetical protein